MKEKADRKPLQFANCIFTQKLVEWKINELNSKKRKNQRTMIAKIMNTVCAVA